MIKILGTIKHGIAYISTLVCWFWLMKLRTQRTLIARAVGRTPKAFLPDFKIVANVAPRPPFTKRRASYHKSHDLSNPRDLYLIVLIVSSGQDQAAYSGNFINVDSRLPDGTKPLPELMLTYQRCSLAFSREQFHTNCREDIDLELGFNNCTIDIISTSPGANELYHIM